MLPKEIKNSSASNHRSFLPNSPCQGPALNALSCSTSSLPTQLTPFFQSLPCADPVAHQNCPWSNPTHLCRRNRNTSGWMKQIAWAPTELHKHQIAGKQQQSEGAVRSRPPTAPEAGCLLDFHYSLSKCCTQCCSAGNPSNIAMICNYTIVQSAHLGVYGCYICNFNAFISSNNLLRTSFGLS